MFGLGQELTTETKTFLVGGVCSERIPFFGAKT